MMQLTQVTSPPPPPHNPRHERIALFVLTILLCLMLALSGCSTPPAPTPLWTPPASALIKADPLPLLPADPAAHPDSLSTVDKAELIKNDLEIVRLYHRLAKRHNELVDAVMEKLKQQSQ